MPSEKKRYPNPDREGAFLVLTDEGAKALGLNPKDGTEHRRPGPAPTDVTNEGGEGLVSSTTAATSSSSAKDDEKPDGALEPGGPTSRARRAAAAEAPQEPGPAPVEGTDPEGAAVEPGEGDGDGDDEPAEGAEPKTSRRRRASS